MVLAICVCGCTATGRYFYLRDAKTGQQQGPFTYRQGERIAVEDHEFLISRVLTTEQMTEDRMEAIVLPELHFNGTPLGQVLATVERLSAENDPEVYRPERGIVIRYERWHDHDPPITMDVERISVLKTLRILECISQGYRWRIDGETVHFGMVAPQPVHYK